MTIKKTTFFNLKKNGVEFGGTGERSECCSHRIQTFGMCQRHDRGVLVHDIKYIVQIQLIN